MEPEAVDEPVTQDENGPEVQSDPEDSKAHITHTYMPVDEPEKIEMSNPNEKGEGKWWEDDQVEVQKEDQKEYEDKL